jgi:hypothetical protein
MPERRVPTLADAQRQVWVRGSIGLLLIGLALIFLLLILVKHVYQTPTYSFFPWGADLRRYVDPVLDDWSVLSLLWRSIPPRHPITGVPTTAMWEYVYAIWGAIVVGGIGGWLRSSAYKRRAQITEFRQEMEREAWRQQARAASGIAPGLSRLDNGYPAGHLVRVPGTTRTLVSNVLGDRDPRPDRRANEWARPALCGIFVLSRSLAFQPQLRNAHNPWGHCPAGTRPGRLTGAALVIIRGKKRLAAIPYRLLTQPHTPSRCADLNILVNSEPIPARPIL